MLRSIPFLLFDGNCAEAMNFYHKCLGGQLTITKLEDTPMKDQFPLEKHQRIINAHLKCGSIEISASDWMAAPEYLPKTGDTFSIFITGGTIDEVKPIFNKLSAGASKDRFQALHALPFGTYGQFTDKFGFRWIFVAEKIVSPDRQKL
jgi:PhnB protein